MVKTGRKKKIPNTTEYTLKKDSLGNIFMAEFINSDEQQIVYEVADFDIIQNQKQTIHEPILRKTTQKNKILIGIKGNKQFIETDIELKNKLSEAKRVRVKIKRNAEMAFVNEVRKLPVYEQKLTNVLGYDGRKYFQYPEFITFQFNYENNNGVLEKNVEYIAPNDNYLDFLKIIPDKNNIKKICDIINNKFARSDDEKIFHKILLSWSISSALKLPLINNGVKLHPILILIGAHRLGKTTACLAFITNMWCTQPLEAENFEGSKGARLKQLTPVVFPHFVDEVKSLDRHSEILKNAAVSGIMKIPKGRKDGGLDLIEKPINIAISTNTFKVSDPALKDRLIPINYTHTYKENRMTDAELIWLNDNIAELGKQIYDDFQHIDVESIINEIRLEYSDYKNRDLYKIIYIKLGEKILNDYKILNDVNIDINLILKKDDGLSVSLKDTLMNIIITEISNIILKDKETLHTVQSVLRTKDQVMPESIYNLLEAKGVFIGYNNKYIILGKTILSTINTTLARSGLDSNYKTMEKFAEDLEKDKNTGPHKIRKDIGQTSKRGLRFELNEIFGDDFDD